MAKRPNVKASHTRIREIVEWVFDHLGDKKSELPNAPTAGAKALLEWAQSSDGNKGDFYRVFYARFLPTKQEVDKQDGRGDGTDRCERTIRKLVANRPPVPGTGAQVSPSQLGMATADPKLGIS